MLTKTSNTLRCASADGCPSELEVLRKTGREMKFWGLHIFMLVERLLISCIGMSWALTAHVTCWEIENVPHPRKLSWTARNMNHPNTYVVERRYSSTHPPLPPFPQWITPRWRGGQKSLRPRDLVEQPQLFGQEGRTCWGNDGKERTPTSTEYSNSGEVPQNSRNFRRRISLPEYVFSLRTLSEILNFDTCARLLTTLFVHPTHFRLRTDCGRATLGLLCVCYNWCTVCSQETFKGRPLFGKNLTVAFWLLRKVAKK